jgi:hypothetical protein
MAQAGIAPVLATPSDAIAAFERDLPKALKGRTLEEAGWRRLDGMSLLVPLQGQQANGTMDDYLLRLGFACYPDWPPSALFVNPQTLSYDAVKDKCWLPKIEGSNEIAIHQNFNGQGQLVCCSLTLEFYAVKHGVQPEHVWNPQQHNFAATINQIDWALRSQFYKGRQDVLPPR